ncbi:MAG: lipid kinase [Deltaproteobacteria bacterium]|nr:lipid kinase [Deltaproteobacteria bacterium]
MLVNVAARSGREGYEPALRMLEALGVRVGRARAVEKAQAFPGEVEAALAEGFRLLLVGGGDGTLSAAVNALGEQQATLGVLPLGTGNDFARSLRIPDDLEAACAVVAANHRRRVDLGRVNGRRFLNAVSLGLSAGIAARLTPSLKRRAGPLAYALAAAPEVASAERFKLALRADDTRSRTIDALQVVVGNGRYHGAGRLVTPHARLSSGRLEAYFLETDDGSGRVREVRGAWNLARFMLLLRRGRHLEHPRVFRVVCRQLVLVADPPQALNVDGELLGHTPAAIDLLPASLEVLAPRPRLWKAVERGAAQASARPAGPEEGVHPS